MLTKEQIEEIKKDRNLLFFIIDILKLKKNNKKTEARAIIENGKVVRKLFLKDRIEYVGKNLELVSRFIDKL